MTCFGTFVTHAGPVCDVTDTDCWAQNGSTHGRVFMSFKRQFFNKQNQQPSEKLLCVFGDPVT